MIDAQPSDVLTGRWATRSARIRLAANTYATTLLANFEHLEARPRTKAVQSVLFSALSQLELGIVMHRIDSPPRTLKLLTLAMLVIGGRDRPLSSPWFAINRMYQTGPVECFSEEMVSHTLRDGATMFYCLQAVALDLFPGDRQYLVAKKPMTVMPA